MLVSVFICLLLLESLFKWQIVINIIKLFSQLSLHPAESLINCPWARHKAPRTDWQTWSMCVTQAGLTCYCRVCVVPLTERKRQGRPAACREAEQQLLLHNTKCSKSKSDSSGNRSRVVRCPPNSGGRLDGISTGENKSAAPCRKTPVLYVWMCR